LKSPTGEYENNIVDLRGWKASFLVIRGFKGVKAKITKDTVQSYSLIREL
jgi:hypothetical protein